MVYLSFGPVPSRRLGVSLGVNNIPPKVCSYSCVYCQLGSTIDMQADRRTFYPVEDIVQAVGTKVYEAENAGKKIDYITFVPDGEPTLDLNLGKEIEALRKFGVRIAVITNSSLLWRNDVREDLMKADWVSLKVDTINESVWQKLNRPSPKLDLGRILDGELALANDFDGFLATETMLVRGVNDDPAGIRETASFLAKLRPDRAYISIPTRPPAEKWVRTPDESVVNQTYQVFKEVLPDVEYLTGYEGTSFAYSGDVEKDLLSITAVHPMREDAVRELISKADLPWKLVEKMISEGKLTETEYLGKKFYLRKFRRQA